MTYLSNASSYLIDALLGLMIYAFLLRFWMQWVRSDFRNQVGQFVLTVTNPVVLPLRRVLPAIGAIDTATVVAAIVVVMIKVVLLTAILGQSPEWLNLFLYSVFEVLRSSIYLFFVALIIGILASWLNPHGYNPILAVAESISGPLLAPFRKLIPAIGGIDISPIFVFLILNLALQFLNSACGNPYTCLA